MLVFEKLLALACKISKIQAIFSIGLQSHTMYMMRKDTEEENW